MGVVLVFSGSSPSAYIRNLIRRIDLGVPNGSCAETNMYAKNVYSYHSAHIWLSNTSAVLVV